MCFGGGRGGLGAGVGVGGGVGTRAGLLTALVRALAMLVNRLNVSASNILVPGGGVGGTIAAGAGAMGAEGATGAFKFVECVRFGGVGGNKGWDIVGMLGLDVPAVSVVMYAEGMGVAG